MATCRTLERRNLYVGRSNWPADEPFEGAVSNIKVWNRGVKWSGTESRCVSKRPGLNGSSALDRIIAGPRADHDADHGRSADRRWQRRRTRVAGEDGKAKEKRLRSNYSLKRKCKRALARQKVRELLIQLESSSESQEETEGEEPSREGDPPLPKRCRADQGEEETPQKKRPAQIWIDDDSTDQGSEDDESRLPAEMVTCLMGAPDVKASYESAVMYDLEENDGEAIAKLSNLEGRVKQSSSSALCRVLANVEKRQMRDRFTNLQSHSNHNTSMAARGQAEDDASMDHAASGPVAARAAERNPQATAPDWLARLQHVDFRCKVRGS